MTTVRVPPVPDQRLPRYQQICDDLARRIAASEWQPEQAIATEAELTAEYSVSTGTVRKAIDQLVASGVLTRSQGRGTYVRRPRFDSSLFRFFRFAGRNGEQVRPTARVTHRAVQVPAAAVRATQDCVSLPEFEVAHAAAYAAWTEARSRTGTYLLEQHALQQEHLQARNCACFCRASHADVVAC